jgi:hypothetical protein
MHGRLIALLSAGAVAAFACGGRQAPAPPAATDGAPSPGVPVAAAAQTPFVVAPTPEPGGNVQFNAALDLGQAPKGGEPQLRGGQEATSAQWPASLYATFSVPGGTAACTAALLGPRVMLTAAHCTPAAGTVTFAYKGHAQPYTATCTRHPRYSGSPKDASADFALCRVTPAFQEPVGFKYETVNTSGMSSLMNATVVLTGFGCISNVAANGQIDGKYRIGTNTIDETSVSTPHRHGDALYEPAERNNLFTTDDPAKANLCPGDSGGPAFVQSAGTGDLTRRTIVGVNSRVFYRDAAQTTYGSSLISATGGPDFRQWAEGWTAQAGAAACGIAGSLPNCRS